MIISIKAERTSDKIHHSFTIKTKKIRKLREEFPEFDKECLQKPQLPSYLMVRNSKLSN